MLVLAAPTRTLGTSKHEPAIKRTDKTDQTTIEIPTGIATPETLIVNKVEMIMIEVLIEAEMNETTPRKAEIMIIGDKMTAEDLMTDAMKNGEPMIDVKIVVLTQEDAADLVKELGHLLQIVEVKEINKVVGIIQTVARANKIDSPMRVRARIFLHIKILNNMVATPKKVVITWAHASTQHNLTTILAATTKIKKKKFQWLYPVNHNKVSKVDRTYEFVSCGWVTSRKVSQRKLSIRIFSSMER